ncbi:alpha/beta hydrolase [Novosphingobium sp. Gsoil 351]|uniref:RBBP9/YdeN family alpha/beta hydrolase n=1 Tax=Novosphingobium sp. Gsoil 351 TaxID=2675225 RepID=UPI0018A80453|nr:alpha/beta hydrolase [Novosphingobium sp. Gsoil 351]
MTNTLAYPNRTRSRAADTPLVLTVPGLGDSGSAHWQTAWETSLDRDVVRVDLGSWDDPHRNTWVNKLNLAIRRAERPVVLVAHSLGCLAVAWWVEYEALQEEHNVVGALLVAPPEVDGAIGGRDPDPRLARFSPAPRCVFPFPSIVVASRNDPWIGFGRARSLAEAWGSRFADAGPAGHINADSALGDWEFGRLLLDQVIARAGHTSVVAAPPQPAPRAQGLVAA